MNIDEFTLNKACREQQGSLTRAFNVLGRFVIKRFIRLLTRNAFQARSYKPENKKYPRVLAYDKWNSTGDLFYFEWDYFMFHNDNYLGAIGLCLINPKKTPVLPSGLLFIVYGYDLKNQKPVRLFHLMPLPEGESKAVKNDQLSYEYVSKNKAKVKWDFPGLSGEVQINAKTAAHDHALTDQRMGPMGQHWQVSSRWPHTQTKGFIETVDGKMDVTGTGYQENSGGFSFLANSGWLFFVHTNDKRCFSLQTYANTHRLSELIYILNGDMRTFSNLTFKLIESVDVELLYGSQYLPKKVVFSCEDEELRADFTIEIDEHVESDKNADLLFQKFFIIFCVSRLSGKVVSKVDGKVIDEFTDVQCGGEYAHHSLWPDKVAVWDNKGRKREVEK